MTPKKLAIVLTSNVKLYDTINSGFSNDCRALICHFISSLVMTGSKGNAC